jgi:hypothetical protein
LSLLALHQFSILFVWFGLVAFVLFCALIARAYERLSREHTGYIWFTLPLILVGISAVRSAAAPFSHDLLNNVLAGTGGCILAFLMFRLSRRMMQRF